MGLNETPHTTLHTRLDSSKQCGSNSGSGFRKLPSVATMLNLMNHGPSICVAFTDVLVVDYTMYTVDRELIVQSTPTMPSCVIAVFGYPLGYFTLVELTQLSNLGYWPHPPDDHVSWTSCPKLSLYLPSPTPHGSHDHSPLAITVGFWALAFKLKLP